MEQTTMEGFDDELPEWMADIVSDNYTVDLSSMLAGINLGGIAAALVESSELTGLVEKLDYSGIHKYLQEKKDKVNSVLNFDFASFTGLEWALYKSDWKMADGGRLFPAWGKTRMQ
jgi:hypothetical protein